jgi:hypothetical protein
LSAHSRNESAICHCIQHLSIKTRLSTRGEGKESVQKQWHSKKEGDLKHAGPEGEASSTKVQSENRERGLTGSEEENRKYKMLRKRKDEDFDDISN